MSLIRKNVVIDFLFVDRTRDHAGVKIHAGRRIERLCNVSTLSLRTWRVPFRRHVFVAIGMGVKRNELNFTRSVLSVYSGYCRSRLYIERFEDSILSLSILLWRESRAWYYRERLQVESSTRYLSLRVYCCSLSGDRFSLAWFLVVELRLRLVLNPVSLRQWKEGVLVCQ